MAKYAHINENGYVTNIVTIEEKIFTDENGQINDELAIRYLKNVNGGTWCPIDDEEEIVEFNISSREAHTFYYDKFRRIINGEVVDESELYLKASNDNISNSPPFTGNFLDIELVESCADLDTYLSNFSEEELNGTFTYVVVTNSNLIPGIGDIYHEDTKDFSDGSPGKNYKWNWRTEQWEEVNGITPPPDDILNDIDNYVYDYDENQWVRINI